MTTARNKAVHKILAHSYFFYFLMFLSGVLLDLLFPVKIFNSPLMLFFGLTLIIFSSVLILWAQMTSRDLVNAKEDINTETFCKGPYCFTRSPTHWGLFFLILGFGIVANAFFIILFTLVSFFTTKFIFLRKEEIILAEKYGAPYLEYKKKVKF